METKQIIERVIGETFIHTKIDQEFTVIGGSQKDEHILVEWEDGKLESISEDKWNDSRGYEIMHITEVSR